MVRANIDISSINCDNLTPREIIEKMVSLGKKRVSEKDKLS